MTQRDTATADDVLHFWFEELGPKSWWQANSQLDTLIRSRFGPLLEQAAANDLAPWRTTAKGRLAEIIVLDQFSRNIYRDTPQAFAQDELALALSQQAIETNALDSLLPDERSFLLMPFMHSESQTAHEQAEALFKAFAPGNNYEFELKHKAIIDRFGRYPHRNAILGRASTAQEIEFLKQPGSSF